MVVYGETFRVQCGPLNYDCVIRCVLRSHILEKPKLNSGTGLIIIKPNIDLSRKEVKKLPINFFTNIIVVMVTQQLTIVIFFFLKDVRCISI